MMSRPEANRADAPFFVVGAERSGTTMFRLMLLRHSRIHIPPECRFVRDLVHALPAQGTLDAQQVQQAQEIITKDVRWGDWGIPEEALSTMTGTLDRPTLAALIDGVFRLTTNGKPRWGCKTPSYVKEIDGLHRVLPDARFIHVIRDGRDVWLSLKAKGWWGRNTLGIARYWVDQVEAGRASAAALPAESYLELRYEDLVRDAEAELRRVCGFLGEEFEESMLAFHEVAHEQVPARLMENHAKTRRPPQASDVDRWKREMSPLRVLLFEAVAWRTMETLGQGLRFPRAAKLVGAALTGVDWAARQTRGVRHRIGLHRSRFWKRAARPGEPRPEGAPQA